jgi:hypothetical protein
VGVGAVGVGAVGVGAVAPAVKGTLGREHPDMADLLGEGGELRFRAQAYATRHIAVCALRVTRS